MGQWCSLERRGVNNPVANDPKRRVSSGSSWKSKGNLEVVRNSKHAAASASADDNSGTLVLSSEYDSIILGGSSNSTQSSIHDRRNGKSVPTIFLLPHQHTLFCERKQRVCTAVGRCQELETIKVSGLEPTKHDWVWFRSSSADIHATKDKLKSTQIIANSENKLEYRLEKGDVNSYIGICYGPIGQTPKTIEHNQQDRFIIANTIGPVLPGPPRALEFTVGGDLRVGCYAKANVTYIGGTEGRSEYWWMRITGDGKRTQITEPKATPDPHSRAFGDPKEDSRFYLVKPEDLRCTLKAKCRPIRIDGAAGEIFTSKSSVVVIAASK
jgi:hypothetical protein